MCCFTRPVKSVSATRIFAREGEGNRQFIVYQMNLEAKEELAMVLPLPVSHGSGEDEVQFINLKDYAAFFSDLDRGFPIFQTTGMANADSRSRSKSEPVLKVYDVGDFQASFVPAQRDFTRLDKRFRLEGDVWEKLPQYQSFGFAVFKLKSGAHQYHPMAFSFPRTDATKLFFPTVHIHDGRVRQTALFDHMLYCQPSVGPLNVLNWAESTGQARQFARIEQAKDILLATEHCYRKELRGRLKNQDTYVSHI